MAFPDSVVDQAWAKAGGKCERCDKELREESQGSKSQYGWEAHQKTAGKDFTVNNCEILCYLCYEATSSAAYGG